MLLALLAPVDFLQRSLIHCSSFKSSTLSCV
jgi:hypothetical protein